VQWLNPAVALGLIALSDWQSQQQRTAQVAEGTVRRLLRAGPTWAPAAGGVAAIAGLGLLARRRLGAQSSRQPELAGVGRPSTTAAPTPQPPTSAGPIRAVDGTASAADLGQTADNGPARSASDDGVTRSREQLRVGTEPVESGRATLRKHVVSEQVTETVPVTHEVPVLEREPITDANLDDALPGPDLSEQEHDVVLHAEQPVVSKETVPVERVRLGTDVVTEDQQVTETLQEERIDTEGTAPSGEEARPS